MLPSQNQCTLISLPQMSCLQIDPDLEEKLNDIDELIESELGFEPTSGGSLKATDVACCSCFLKTLDLPDGSTDNLG